MLLARTLLLSVKLGGVRGESGTDGMVGVGMCGGGVADGGSKGLGGLSKEGS